jgi:hypothetical protein
LILGKVQGLSSFRVCQTSPALGDLNTVKKGIKGLASGRAHNLLAIDVVADVRVGIVERERNVSDGVDGALSIGVITVINRIDLCIFVTLASIGILHDTIVGFRAIGIESRWCSEAVIGIGRGIIAMRIIIIVVVFVFVVFVIIGKFAVQFPFNVAFFKV